MKNFKNLSYIITLPIFAGLGSFFVWIFSDYHDVNCEKNLPVFLGVGKIEPFQINCLTKSNRSNSLTNIKAHINFFFLNKAGISYLVMVLFNLLNIIYIFCQIEPNDYDYVKLKDKENRYISGRTICIGITTLIFLLFFSSW